MDLQSLGPGYVVAGKFRLDALLGQGGMGSVWRAHHLALNSPIALKLIDPSLAAHPEARARFMREAQAAAALRSPHVVQTFDFGVDRDVPYIAMELLEGENLGDRIERLKCITPAMTATIMTHVARAIAKAHEAGIVHRDLKPDNIFLVGNDDEEIAKVLDFGVAKATGTALGRSDSQTRTGALIGTPFYMSPEQAQGDKAIDYRSDLWSLAIITYECLLGHRPFYADGLGNLLVQICVAPVPVPSQRGRVPPGFDAWFARATQRDPALRFESAREQAHELRAVLADDPGRSSQPSEPGWEPPVRGPAPLAQSGGSGVSATSNVNGQVWPVGTTAGMVQGDAVVIPKRSSAGLWATLLLGLVVAGGVATWTMWPTTDKPDVASAQPEPSVAAASAPAIVPVAPSASVAATPASESASASASAPPEGPPPGVPRVATPPASPPVRATATATRTASPATPPAAPPRQTSAPREPARPPPTARRDRLGF